MDIDSIYWPLLSYPARSFLRPSTISLSLVNLVFAILPAFTELCRHARANSSPTATSTMVAFKPISTPNATARTHPPFLPPNPLILAPLFLKVF